MSRFLLLVCCAILLTSQPYPSQAFGYGLFDNIKSKPFVRRHKLKRFDSTYFDSEENRWKANFVYVLLANTYEVNIHQMNGESGNRVFTHKDGHSEAVYDANGDLVTDCANMGSYNYHPMQKEPLLHFANDSWPWLAWGNCREEPTNSDQRIEAYLKDLKSSAELLFSHADELQTPSVIELREKDRWQTVALFFKIMDSEPGADLSQLARKDKATRDAEFEDTFAKFSMSFKKIMIE